jgi:cytidine deaminase
LTATEEEISLVLAAAKQARQLAYAPYSKFRMGAAVLTDDGTINRGCLIENVSLGLAMCAERVALFSTIANQTGKPKILGLVAPRTSGSLTFPCGACLQVALELGGPELLIVVADTKGETDRVRLGDVTTRMPYKEP